MAQRGTGEGEGEEPNGLLDRKGVAVLQAQDEAVAARKELAKTQREKAMAQMQNMQRKFLEKNKEHMLDLESSADPDEVYESLLTHPLSSSPPPLMQTLPPPLFTPPFLLPLPLSFSFTPSLFSSLHASHMTQCITTLTTVPLIEFILYVYSASVHRCICG